MSDAEVWVDVGAVRLPGRLVIPDDPKGLVLFAHGSGSSRLSPRNRFVASHLNQDGLGTLLFDLLTRDEEADRSNVFDVQMLGARLAAVAGWVRGGDETSNLPLGYFGASTGAAAALVAASGPRAGVAAVVSRGGRPDLAAARLPLVEAPTLLIVGGRDSVVLDLNRQAMSKMVCECRLEVVPGATHLFEEVGTLERVAELASNWFVHHFAP